MKTFKIGGVHPKDQKLSANKAIDTLALPKQAIIPLSQHIGAPATPVVAKGDYVRVGQLIAKATGFMSANIHSPYSGTIEKIDNSIDAWGMTSPSIFIRVEGDEWMPEINCKDDIIRICNLEPAEIIRRIGDAGIVGLGGACFPTHIKLIPPPTAKAEVLIINGVECEPYLTCDHRLMLEHAEEIFIGISIIMKAINVNRAIVGIECNKKDAIEHFKNIATRHFGIEICPLKMHYPQGGEKQLIDATIGRQVPSGALPIAVGAVVQNVATCYAVYEAVQKNKPLIDRVLTVTGPDVENARNLRVRFGTPLNDIITAAGGLPENTGKIIAGGPMMGRAISNLESTTSKRTSGLLIMPDRLSKRAEVENCIRCGKCVDACPMALEPYLLHSLTEREMWDRLEKEQIMDCIECGCCLFSCPSHRPLLDYVRLGKATVGGIIRNRNAKK
ncbi:MAG: electron transport complex subunit RsxC [Paludibacteraceae bacterium]|nr:electron transport complex subunit RsxC [Paludibacteraceae bacterium]